MAKRKRKISRRTNTGTGIDFSQYDKWSPAEFHRKRHGAYTHFYQEWKKTDLQKAVFKWMAKNGYTRSQINKAKNATGLSAPGSTVGAWCLVLLEGCPDYLKSHDKYWQSLPATTGKVDKISNFVKKSVDRAIEDGTKNFKESKKEKKSNVISIQDRMNLQVIDACNDIDMWLDAGYQNPSKFKVKDFNIAGHFAEKKIKSIQARKIIQHYENDLNEFKEYLELPPASKIENDYDLQLKQGYKHFSKTEIRKFVEALEKIVDECNLIIQTKKATRKVRNKKVLSVSKIVKNVKYEKVNNTFKIASVNPELLVNCKEVWTFNTKYRMLTHYVADAVGHMTVKGTTLIGFDEIKSEQRKLRKPDEQLRKLMSSGKVALRKFMANLTTKPSMPNGRINNNTVILIVK